MTMFTAESRNRQLLCSGGYAEGFGGYDCETLLCIGRGSDPVEVCLSSSIMTEEDQEERAAESSSNSKDHINIITANIAHHHQQHHPEDQERGDDDDDEGWLQLSIGGGGQHRRDHSSSTQPNDTTRNNRSRAIDLELLPGNSSNNNNNNKNNSSSCSQMRPLGSLMPDFGATRPPVMNFSPSGFFLQQHPAASTANFPHPHHQYQEINWGFRPPIPISIGPSSSSLSLSSFSTPSSSLPYFSRPFQLYAGVDMGPSGPGLDFRVIQPPRRPHSGLWFMLQASQNQEKEPYLPQISKSYLRIKDGRMTIRVVIKYLVNKLRLENESEIEISCRGQRLVPFLTLQHVRDDIWSRSNSPRDFITLLPNSSAADHIMVLHYGRTTTAAN